MPKYRVNTDQGTFAVELDREPSSPEELQSLVSEALGGEVPTPKTPAAAAAPKPEGVVTGALMETPRRAAAGFSELQSAGEPGLPFEKRLGRGALGVLGMIGALPPFAQTMYLGGRAAKAALPTGPGVVEQPYAPSGHPWRNVGLTPEEATAAAQETGEFFGGMVPAPPVGRILRGLRGTAVPPPPPPRLALPPAEGPTVVGPARTFEVGQRGVELIEPEGRIVREAVQPGAVLGREPLMRGGVGPESLYVGEMPTAAEIAAARSALVRPQKRLIPPEVRLLPEEQPIVRQGEALLPEPVPGKSIVERLRAGEFGSKVEPKQAPTPGQAPAAPTPLPGRGGKTWFTGTRRLTATDTPSDFARGIPSAEKLVETVQDRSMIRRLIEEDTIHEATQALGPLGKNKDSLHRVTKLLDTDGGSTIAPQVLNTAELKSFTALRAWFNKLADSTNMNPEKRITDYFPRIREQLGVKEKQVVVVGGKEIPTYITDTTPKRIIREFFEKDRTALAPADDLGVEPILAYARGAARKIAYGGGKNPATGAPITSMLDEIRPLLPGIPDAKASYFADYVNDVIGIPRGKPGEVSQRMIDVNKAMREKIGVDITGLEFGRTITGNVMTPTQNLTQMVLALGHVGYKNWVKGFDGVRKAWKSPEEWERLRQLGIVTRMTKADDDLLSVVGTGRGLEHLIEKGAKPFQMTENVNRIQTFTAAMREAADKGLKGVEAERWARKVVRDVHFTFGPEDASELARTWRNPIGRSVLQYKSFPAKYTIAMKNFAKDDAADIARFGKKIWEGDISGAFAGPKPLRVATVGGTTTALFGAGAVIPGAEELFGLEPDALLSTGVVGAIGLSLGHQVGLGVLPLDTMRSFTFWLPGPAISHFLEAASAGATLAKYGLAKAGVGNINKVQTNFDLQSLVRGEAGTTGPIDPDLTTARIVRSVPLAGIQTERVRQGVIHFRSTAPEAQRRPVTGLQALGIEPVGPANPQMRPTPGRQISEAARIATGAREMRTDIVSRLVDKLQSESKIDQAAAHAAAQRLLVGDVEEAQAIIKQRGGVPPSMATIREAVRGAALPPEIRRGLRAPLPMRGPFLGNLPPLPPRPEE